MGLINNFRPSRTVYLTSDVPSVLVNPSFTSLTDLTLILTPLTTYSFTCYYPSLQSNAGSGIDFDFGGGTCTASNFRVNGGASSSGGSSWADTSTSLTGALGLTNYGGYWWEFLGTITVNAGGSFIPRFTSHSGGGNITIYQGAWLTMMQKA